MGKKELWLEFFNLSVLSISVVKMCENGANHYFVFSDLVLFWKMNEWWICRQVNDGNTENENLGDQCDRTILDGY